jgi:hypothetical protein
MRNYFERTRSPIWRASIVGRLDAEFPIFTETFCLLATSINKYFFLDFMTFVQDEIYWKSGVSFLKKRACIL